MKRSEINNAIKEASAAFERHHWYPSQPQMGCPTLACHKTGLTAVNLSEHEEYCEN